MKKIPILLLCLILAVACKQKAIKASTTGEISYQIHRSSKITGVNTKNATAQSLHTKHRINGQIKEPLMIKEPQINLASSQWADTTRIYPSQKPEKWGKLYVVDTKIDISDFKYLGKEYKQQVYIVESSSSSEVLRIENHDSLFFNVKGNYTDTIRVNPSSLKKAENVAKHLFYRESIPDIKKRIQWINQRI